MEDTGAPKHPTDSRSPRSFFVLFSTAMGLAVENRALGPAFDTKRIPFTSICSRIFALFPLLAFKKIYHHWTTGHMFVIFSRGLLHTWKFTVVNQSGESTTLVYKTRYVRQPLGLGADPDDWLQRQLNYSVQPLKATPITADI